MKMSLHTGGRGAAPASTNVTLGGGLKQVKKVDVIMT